ncbi:MAG: hypothetical protein WC846_03395 [Candidatus Gracilibacteria bacterium]|jgi:hypothetical protein
MSNIYIKKPFVVLFTAFLLLSACTIEEGHTLDEGKGEPRFSFEKIQDQSESCAITILVNEQRTKEITINRLCDTFDIYLLEHTEDAAFIAVSWSDDYTLLYHGADELYKYDFTSGKVDNFRRVNDSTGFVTDISPDRQTFIAFTPGSTGPAGITQTVVTLNTITSEQTLEKLRFNLEGKFSAAGNGLFSGDGKFAAFAASKSGLLRITGWDGNDPVYEKFGYM